jgi:hypothetical protein
MALIASPAVGPILRSIVKKTPKKGDALWIPIIKTEPRITLKPIKRENKVTRTPVHKISIVRIKTRIWVAIRESMSQGSVRQSFMIQ